MNKLGILGVPITIGQPNKGADLGPDAIRHAGLYTVLQNLNASYQDYGNVQIKNEEANQIDQATNLKNLNEVAAASELTANKVSEMIQEGQFPLLLGGDHSMAIGTIAGVQQHYENLGVIWYDAHADFNTEETSPSGNIHGMSLAVNLGMGHEKLTSILQNEPKIKPENVIIIGARSIDSGERELIKEKGIKVYTAHEVEQQGIESVIKESLNYLTARTDGIHLSFDVDSLDPIYVPGTGTPVEGGLSVRESHYALRLLNESEKIVSAEFVEVNPLLDERNQTAKRTVELIGSLLGERYI
ncbi:arginase [Allobacillus halotolerans]|uniref:Arginase n=1 Tax=Allobacillus halotolerans TaxID=570278 RepID=A0ABS6GQ93_9BACI|nr:arginase [Allobacillus halotolerans]MBU6080810.1 arginase [Allobacillus halotolerans]